MLQFGTFYAVLARRNPKARMPSDRASQLSIPYTYRASVPIETMPSASLGGYLLFSLLFKDGIAYKVLQWYLLYPSPILYKQSRRLPLSSPTSRLQNRVLSRMAHTGTILARPITPKLKPCFSIQSVDLALESSTRESLSEAVDFELKRCLQTETLISQKLGKPDRTPTFLASVEQI
jgi:hypothetical protein